MPLQKKDNRYLKGIKINFINDKSKIDEGASFDFSDYITDEKALMQNTAINVYTSRGSDKLNPSRGTDLIKDTWLYSVYNRDGLIHVANFASSDSKEYINDDILNFSSDSPYNKSETTIEAMNNDTLSKITLIPNITINNNVVYNDSIVTTKGKQIGDDKSIITRFYD